jgi:hypothetical protein
MAAKLGESIPTACQDWGSTKAAYRFFANGAVSEEQILSGHFAATKERIAASDEPVLILHDTTEFSYKREADAASLGVLHRYPKGKDSYGKLREVTSGSCSPICQYAPEKRRSRSSNGMRCAGKTEVFHKILKSGCRAEESKLRNAERLTSFIAVCRIVSWRVF